MFRRFFDRFWRKRSEDKSDTEEDGDKEVNPLEQSEKETGVVDPEPESLDESMDSTDSGASSVVTVIEVEPKPIAKSADSMASGEASIVEVDPQPTAESMDSGEATVVEVEPKPIAESADSVASGEAGIVEVEPKPIAESGDSSVSREASIVEVEPKPIAESGDSRVSREASIVEVEPKPIAASGDSRVSGEGSVVEVEPEPTAGSIDSGEATIVEGEPQPIPESTPLTYSGETSFVQIWPEPTDESTDSMDNTTNNDRETGLGSTSTSVVSPELSEVTGSQAGTSMDRTQASESVPASTSFADNSPSTFTVSSQGQASSSTATVSSQGQASSSTATVSSQGQASGSTAGRAIFLKPGDRLPAWGMSQPSRNDREQAGPSRSRSRATTITDNTPERYFIPRLQPGYKKIYCRKPLNCGHMCEQEKDHLGGCSRICAKIVKYTLPCGHVIGCYCGNKDEEGMKTFPCEVICGATKLNGRQCEEFCHFGKTCEEVQVQGRR